MKNAFFFLAAASLLATQTPAVAQNGPTDTGLALGERATVMTWRIAERTQLSEGQYVKLRRLNMGLLAQTAELRQQFKADPTTLDRSLADLQQRYEWDVAALLQPKQLAVYDGLRTEFTAANLR